MFEEEEEEGLSEEEEEQEDENEDIFTKLQPFRSKGDFINGSRGFPGEIKNQNPYFIRLGAPAVDIMNRMVMAFYDCQAEDLASEENWRAWCAANDCPTMAEHYELFAYELMERPSKHNLFQAISMRYNVAVTISEMHEGMKMHYYYDIILAAESKEILIAAVNYLLSVTPRAFKIYLRTPCDYRMGDDGLEKEISLERFIEGGPEGDEEEEEEEEEEGEEGTEDESEKDSNH